VDFKKYAKIIMAIDIWGDKPKSQTDATTVDEEIAALIQAHEDDEDAHLEAGESLQSHKASEIIDHLALSIVNDKIANGEVDLSKLSASELQAYICFESLDNWLKSSTGVTAKILNASLITSGTLNDLKYLIADGNVNLNIASFDYDMYFQTALQLFSTTSQIVYFGIGFQEGISEDAFVGFKVLNGTLYACIVDTPDDESTEHLHEITGVNITDLNVYKVYYDQALAKFYFYVNGILKYTHDGDVPLNLPQYIFTYTIQTTTTMHRDLSVCYLLYSRKIN
jgi:hypothetical protein